MWTDHIHRAVGKTYGLLRQLDVFQLYLPLEVRSLFAKTYLTPSLMHGIEDLGCCDGVSFRKMIVAFNNIARY